MWTVPAIVFAIAGFTILLSLPGIPKQMREFVEWIGMSGAEWQWWNYAGVSIGLILLFLSVYPLWRRLLRVRVRKEGVVEVFHALSSIWDDKTKAGEDWTLDLIRLATMPFLVMFWMAVGFGPFILFLYLVRWALSSG